MLKLSIVFATGAVFCYGAACESLTSLRLTKGRVTSSQLIPGGTYTASGGRAGGRALNFKDLPAFCKVTATLKPSSDSDIKIEVWMPAEGWNGKLEAVGNGAWAGSISYPAMAAALAAGFATASTDTGHEGNNAAFIAGHPEKLIDFAYRAVHEMTIAAKSIIAAEYGRGPKYSYWNGCSSGGRQALIEAQRYPRDFDGIIAGDPSNDSTRMQAQELWTSQQAHKDEASYIPPEKYELIHKAVLDACDALDGVQDGVLENPRLCHFDPVALVCKPDFSDTSACLTPPQVELAAKIYDGPKGFYPGFERGSELGWGLFVAGPKPMSFAVEMYQVALLADPGWNYLDLDLKRDVARAVERKGKIIDAVDPNLKPLFEHGGKLIQYHGWADPGIPPLSSIEYYQDVAHKLGGVQAIDNSFRLFMIPGMGHCGGGDGTSTFDMITALDRWVEKGEAPNRIIASRVRKGAVDRTRPLCPYPQVASYKGSGSTDDAASFNCTAQ